MYNKKTCIKYLVIVFESVVTVTFQSVFYLETYQNIFLKKIIFNINSSKWFEKIYKKLI